MFQVSPCVTTIIGLERRGPDFASGSIMRTLLGADGLPSRTFEAGQGDSFVVHGGVQHQASALAPSVVIDVFTPCREDYL
jgi:hypothetical protein